MNEKFEKYQLLLTAVLVVANIFLVTANFFLWSTTKGAVQEARRASQGTLVAQLNRDLFFEERMYRVHKAIESKKPFLKSHKGEVAEQDIDAYIGFFDMVCGFVKQGILDSNLVDDNFEGYAEEAYENKEVREFLSDVRRDMNDEKQYDQFEEWGKRKICKK